MLAPVERTPAALINIPCGRDGDHLNFAIKHAGDPGRGRREHVEFLIMYRIPVQGVYNTWLAEIMADVWDNRLPDRFKASSRMSFRFLFAKDNPAFIQPGDPNYEGRGDEPTMRYSVNTGTADAPLYI